MTFSLGNDLWPDESFVLIGMVHLQPLPGSPAYSGSFSLVLERAKRDAEILADGGIDAIMIENFGDTPFYPRKVPGETVAHMTRAINEISKVTNLPLGVNVLRNDGCAALSIASATNASFVRINVLSGSRWTDQGLIEGNAHEVLRHRSHLGLPVQIFADVDVKHSAPVARQSLAGQTEELINRAGADGIIVSGDGTGKLTSVEDLQSVKDIAAERPIWIGSGFEPDQLPQVRDLVRGAIVGTALKQNGDVTAPVCPQRVQTLVNAR